MALTPSKKPKKIPTTPYAIPERIEKSLRFHSRRTALLFKRITSGVSDSLGFRTSGEVLGLGFRAALNQKPLQAALQGLPIGPKVVPFWDYLIEF